MQAVNIYPSQKGIVPKPLIDKCRDFASWDYWWHRSSGIGTYQGELTELTLTITTLHAVPELMTDSVRRS
jgi:hypothetical protein